MKKHKIIISCLLSISILLSIGAFAFALYMYNNPKVIYVNGLDGEDGLDGKNGIDGKNGLDGKNGVDGKDGKDGSKGEKGDQGEIGPQGPQGIQGDTGPKGEDGSSFLTGVGLPLAELGNDGDTYLDTDSEDLDLYKKVDGEWELITKLRDSSSSGGVIVTTDYEITIEDSDPTQGTISGDQNYAASGEIVTFTITEISPYIISIIVIKDTDTGDFITTLETESLVANAEGVKTLTYTMVAQNITVSATFAETVV